MSTISVDQIISRLTEAGPLEANRFAKLLGATLRPGEDNPFWRFFTFDLADGPFGGGELRLSSDGDRALLILEPRSPLGLGVADVDRTKLGAPAGMLPNPRIPPEGVDTEYFHQSGAHVAVQWTHVSRRVRSVVLKWEPKPAA
jgi:hypothetical protein